MDKITFQNKLTSDGNSMNELSTETSPLVTIGFLTYNHKTNIDPAIFIGALESLVNQNYTNKEIVIFDDCSTDGTYEICQKYAARYSFIKLFRNEKNLGAMENFEKLLSNTSGDFFLWACPDDGYAKNYLTECVGRFNKNKNAIIVATALKTTYDNGDIQSFHYHDFFRKLPFRKLVRNTLKSIDSLGNNVHYPPLIHSSLVKTKFIPKLYCREQFYVIEEAWFLNALIWGGIEYIDDVLYFRRDFSLSHSVKLKEHGAKLSERFGFLKYILMYVIHFWLQPSIKMSKKFMYLHLALIAMKIRVYPKMKAQFKVMLLNLIRKIGFMRYDSK